MWLDNGSLLVQSGLSSCGVSCARGYQDHATVLAGVERVVVMPIFIYMHFDPCVSCEFLYDFLGYDFLV